MRKLILCIVASWCVLPAVAAYRYYVATHPAPDPVAKRLESGTEVIACPCDEFPDSTSVCVRNLPEGSSILGNWDVVPVGTRFRIVSDESKSDVTTTRLVKILILEGKHANRPGAVMRSRVRAIPR